MLTATGMALTMPSTTAGLVGSLPAGKAGVGSAVNDTTREVGGALGIAVMGSVLTSVYRESLSLPAQLPAAAADAARRSIGAALEVAGRAPGALGDPLAQGARLVCPGGIDRVLRRGGRDGSGRRVHLVPGHRRHRRCGRVPRPGSAGGAPERRRTSRAHR
ncbi:MAG: hypothetical protein IPH81_21010 [Candidatus Microthrix sp.]|nr:hypothetical protein [Candidatus Microthrix sp.]